MSAWKRRVFAALALAALLALDSALTWRLAARRAPENGLHAIRTNGDPLACFHRQRQQLRADQEARLSDIIHGGGDAALADEARHMLLDMLGRDGAETDIEGVLQSRGFAEAVVSIGENSADVLVRGEVLTARESSVILDLVARRTGLEERNIKIIPVK